MRSLLLGALCASFASTASARTLRVDDAVDLALEHSHTVAAAEAGEDKARAELRESQLQFFPKLSASGGYRRLDKVPYVEFDMSSMGGGGGDPCADIDPETLPEGFTPEMASGMCYMIMGWLVGDTSGEPSRIEMGRLDNYFGGITLEQVVFAGGAMHHAHAAYRDFHTGSLEQVRLTRQQAAYDAEQGFYSILAAREAVQVTSEAEEAMDAYVQDLQAVVEVGAGSRADLLAAQSEQSKTRLTALRTAHMARLAESSFKVLLGLPEDEELELVMDDAPPELGLPADLADLRAMAWRQRPDLASIDASLDAMGHLSNATWASWLPAVVVQGNMNWQNPNYSNEPEWMRTADITVGASWTLWDRGAALHKSRAARAGIRQLQSQRSMLAEMMAVELEAALSSYEESQIELEVAELGLEQAEEAYRLERERFEQGMANNTQLLAAHARQSGARLSLLQARTQHRISHAALRKAVGMDPTQ